MRAVAALVACLILVSCSSRQIAGTNTEVFERAYQLRASSLRALNSWNLTGRLSIDDGEDGGSGKLNWEVHETGFLLKFRGTLGKASWQLTSTAGFAELEKSDGSITRAANVDELLQKELGWAVPVGALKWWVLGVAAPGKADSMHLDRHGRITAMHQNGWDITYRKYHEFGEYQLPARMDAVNGRYRVKIAVSSWRIRPGQKVDG